MRALILAAALAGCAGYQPAIYGNAQGGTIDWFGTTTAQVHQMAEAHCAKHGREARITDIRAKAGGHVMFECI